MPFLDEIVERKREEIRVRRRRTPIEDLHERIRPMPPTRGFLRSLHGRSPLALIAEIKKASPSKGTIRPSFDPADLGGRLEKAGAAALSVLTDEHFFQGHLDYLGAVRASCALPLLEKDFVLDPYQIVEARASGADAVLLIAALLSDEMIREFLDLARALGLDCLVETHSEKELDRALALDAPLIGINNRDLKTFDVDPERAIRLAPRIPQGRTIVAESGIQTHDDIRRLAAAGIHAVLIGETIMRRDDVAAAARELLGAR